MATEVIAPQVDTAHPKDGNAAYEAEMLAKANAGLGVDSGKQEQTLLAGKYKSQEDLDKGILELIKKKSGGDLEGYYKNLEREFHGTTHNGGIKTEQPNQTPPQEKEGKQGDAGEGQEQEKTRAVKLDFDRYGAEFTQNGTLADATIAEIEATGIPRPIIEQYLQGLSAVVELNKSHAYNLVGGEDNYNQMIAWARTGLTAEQKDIFNKAIATNDLTKRGTAIANLYKQYKFSNPQLLDGEGPAPAGDIYTSIAQLSADQKDPRYKKDPAFRQAVMDKLGRSKIM